MACLYLHRRGNYLFKYGPKCCNINDVKQYIQFNFTYKDENEKILFCNDTSNNDITINAEDWTIKVNNVEYSLDKGVANYIEVMKDQAEYMNNKIMIHENHMSSLNVGLNTLWEEFCNTRNYLIGSGVILSLIVAYKCW